MHSKSKNNLSVNIIAKLIIYLVLLIVAVATLFPVIYSIFGAFKDTQELMTSGKLLPEKISWENYVYVWSKVNFARYTTNSLIVTVAVVIIRILMTTITAYVFSRRDFKGGKTIHMAFLASMFINAGAATMYPIYKLVVDMGINKNYLGLIFINCGVPVSLIILGEGYLKGIPTTFDEAAKIDGCSFIRTFAQIIFPMMKPFVAIVALLTFRDVWNSYLMPMIITFGQPKLQLLSVAIVDLRAGGGGMATMWSCVLAAVNISIVPVITVYIICNKQFVNGLIAGGIKE